MLCFCIHLLLAGNVEILFGDSWSYVFFGAWLRLRTFLFLGGNMNNLETVASGCCELSDKANADNYGVGSTDESNYYLAVLEQVDLQYNQINKDI